MGRLEGCLFEDVFRNHSADLANVCLTLKFKFSHKAIGEGQDQFTVRDQLGTAGGLDAEKLTFGIGHGAERFPFSGNALHVNGNDALVGKNQLVSNRFEGAGDGLTLNQKTVDLIANLGNIDGLSAPCGIVVKVNHGKTFL